VKERIEPRVIEAFADITTSRQDESFLGVRDGRELLFQLAPR
jgi:hypothetical protein